MRNATPSKPKKEAPAGTQLLVKKLKDALANRGARGFIGLQRKFRIMDDDGSKTLNLAEFKKGLTESGLGLPENDMRMLYQHFDGDGSGTVDFEEFIQGLRDPLNERRLTLVRLAFAKLDKDGKEMGVGHTIVRAGTLKGGAVEDPCVDGQSVLASLVAVAAPVARASASPARSAAMA